MVYFGVWEYRDLAGSKTSKDAAAGIARSWHAWDWLSGGWDAATARIQQLSSRPLRRKVDHYFDIVL